MQKRILKLKSPLLASLLLMTLGFNAYASGWQSTPASAPQQKNDKQKPFTAQELALIEQMQVELEGCKRVDKLKSAQITRLKEYAAALEAILKTDEELLAKLKAANESRRTISTLEDERAATFQKLADELKTQLERAIRQRNFWRRAAAVLTGIGALVGFLIGVAVSKN